MKRLKTRPKPDDAIDVRHQEIDSRLVFTIDETSGFWKEPDFVEWANNNLGWDVKGALVRLHPPDDVDPAERIEFVKQYAAGVRVKLPRRESSVLPDVDLPMDEGLTIRGVVAGLVEANRFIEDPRAVCLEIESVFAEVGI